jgi:hypothetical protein
MCLSNCTHRAITAVDIDQSEAAAVGGLFH